MYIRKGRLLNPGEELPEGVNLPPNVKEKKYRGIPVYAVKMVPSAESVIGCAGSALTHRAIQENGENGKPEPYLETPDGGILIRCIRNTAAREYLLYLDEEGRLRYLFVSWKVRLPFLILVLLLSLGMTVGASAAAGILWDKYSTRLPPRDEAVIARQQDSDPDAVRQKLQEQVATLTVSISASPVQLDDGSYAAQIVNDRENRYNVAVRILNQEGELLYASPILKPGEELPTVRLDRPLPAGEIRATAYFYAYSTVGENLDGEYVGCTYVDNIKFTTNR